MRYLIIISLTLWFNASALAAVNDIPDGATATITPLPGLAMLRLSNDRRAYTVPISRIVGLQDKPAGCILWIEGPSGIQQLDFVITGEQLLAHIRAAHEPAK